MAVNLSDADLSAIKQMMLTAIDEKVPSIIHSELVKIGIAASDEGEQIERQDDFRFLRKIRKASDAAQGMLWHRVVNWSIGIGFTALGIGILTMLTKWHVVSPPHPPP